MQKDLMLSYEEWDGFSGRLWKEECNVRDFIANNYNKQITLGDIAASGNISKSLCNTLFHQYVGESPINYLMHLRCRKVAEFLRAGKIPMTEIAALTGFGGVSYMSETFRKFFEKSPREYRKDWESR